MNYAVLNFIVDIYGFQKKTVSLPCFKLPLQEIDKKTYYHNDATEFFQYNKEYILNWIRIHEQYFPFSVVDIELNKEQPNCFLVGPEGELDIIFNNEEVDQKVKQSMQTNLFSFYLKDKEFRKNQGYVSLFLGLPEHMLLQLELDLITNTLVETTFSLLKQNKNYPCAIFLIRNLDNFY